MAVKSAAAAAGLVDRPSLTLKRRLNAEPAKVYAAWIDPQKIARWFAPASARANSGHAVIDARVGGRFRVGFVLDNGENFEVGGVYRELVPNQRLVFSWAWHTTPERESQVTVSLRPDGDGTMLTLHHEQLFDQAACDSHARGWNNALDQLADTVSA
jgi:uncharacterized protein YndB with AHSA1/START domain